MGYRAEQTREEQGGDDGNRSQSTSRSVGILYRVDAIFVWVEL